MPAQVALRLVGGKPVLDPAYMNPTCRAPPSNNDPFWPRSGALVGRAVLWGPAVITRQEDDDVLHPAAERGDPRDNLLVEQHHHAAVDLAGAVRDGKDREKRA